MLSLDQAQSDLSALDSRIKQCEQAQHALAPYLREQAGIITRLIDAIREDRAVNEPFYQHEADLQESECAMLLGSLKEELDLVDRNAQLAAETPKKTVNVRDLGALGDGAHDDSPAIAEALQRAAALGPGARVLLPTGRYALATLQGDEQGKGHLFLSGLSDLNDEG
ncbi:MAG: glycosyl hydrolase family 28-related protein, partial [Candidatus Sumerlaeota bacterium]|nr:glycosyl hydrolase family 28-related protein [Candidatus Sumerlaeota bacterium]